MSHAKITNQTDLVAHLITALGFTPTSSVALQLLDGEKAFASLRVDVAPPGDTTAWAHQVTGIVRRLEQVTGVILVSFEDDQAMTAGQYEELGDQLAHIGAPIRRAVLVTNGMVMDYEGDGTDAMAIWVAGAMHQKSTRDLVAVVTATADMSLESITNVLLGETVVEDREFFDHAVEMLYRCAHYVAGEPFANILCLLGWSCWMTGHGSEAQKFLLRAGDECPGHRLSEILTLLVTQGKVPATALIDPKN